VAVRAYTSEGSYYAGILILSQIKKARSTVSQRIQGGRLVART